MTEGSPVLDLDPDLSMLTTEQLLRRALVLDDDEDLLFALGRAARRELDLLVNLGELRPGMAPSLADVTPVLESVDRKLAVAFELTRRQLLHLRREQTPPRSAAIGAPS